MAKEERNSWFQYREPYDPSMLGIGTLAFDFRNPGDYKPFRLTPPLTDVEFEKWVITEPRPNTWLQIGTSKSRGVGGGLLNFLELDLSKEKQESKIAVGSVCRVAELRDPEDFLNQHILQTFPGVYWLSTRLAISRKLCWLRKVTFQHPHIWLLTKVYEIDDGRTFTIKKENSAQSGTLSVPLPDPCGISQLLQLNPGVRAHTSSGMTVQMAFDAPGRKVWAAQWQRLDVRYTSVDPSQTLLQNQIPLLNVWSAQEHRGEESIAELNIKEADDLLESGSSDTVSHVEISDDDWKAFDEEIHKRELELNPAERAELGLE